MGWTAGIFTVSKYDGFSGQKDNGGCGADGDGTHIHTFPASFV